MGHHAQGLRRARLDPRADRRPQAGDLRLPRRGRGRVPQGQPGRRGTLDAQRELAQRRGAPQGIRRALRRRPSGAPRHRLSTRRGCAAERPATPRRRSRERAAPGPGRARRRRARGDGRQGAPRDRRRASSDRGRPGRPDGRAVGGKADAPRAPPGRERRRRGGAEPGSHRGARAVEQGSVHRARRAARGGRARGHRRSRHGLPRRARTRVAPAPRGAGTADLARAGLARRPHAIRRVVGGSGRGGERGRVGGPPLGPAPLGLGAPRQGCGHALRDGVRRARRPGPGAGPPERRPLHDGPAPRRAATARSGRERGRRRNRHGQLVGPAHQRGRPRRRERGPDPKARVGLRGGAGHHDPPEQGTRVPHCHVPLRVGRLHPPDRRARVPRPRP